MSTVMVNAEQTKTGEYKYLVDDPAFPYCAGCGHTWINRQLDSALKKLGRDPREINLVSDIGCVGLVDKLFHTNTIHTTHGRSTAFATGLQLADEVLFDNDTVHVVMIGDGGSTIGLLHLVEAAKMNANITVILHNNFLYGMTGGQHSGLTPENFNTATTRGGNMIPPVQLAEVVKASHAGFITRKLATERDLDDAILEAIKYPGFALVEVIELCTGYATKWNKMSKDDVHEILVNSNMEELGTIVERKDRTSYGQSYKNHFPKKEASSRVKNVDIVRELKLAKPFSLVMAGSAGEGVQFASAKFLEAGIANGLNVIQKNDNPVTIGTGFSIAMLNCSSEEIYYSEIEVPDYILISSLDGLNRAKEFIAKSNSDTLILMDESLVEDAKAIDFKGANLITRDFRKLSGGKKLTNIMMLGFLSKYLKDIPLSALEESITALGKNVENTISALRAGAELD